MNPDNKPAPDLNRREFLRLSAIAAGMLGGTGSALARTRDASGTTVQSATESGQRYNPVYAGDRLNRLAYPLGGLGAGMICLEGTGALSHVSVRNQPNVFNEPCMFAAVAVRGPRAVARVLEGPVPGWKHFGMPGCACGGGEKSLGLPRFRQARFAARFPFGTVSLADPDVPLSVELTGWSPFTPGDADSSSLPVAALEYRFTNPGRETVEAVFSFNARNFLALREPSQAPRAVRPIDGGFMLWSGASAGRPWEEAAFAATVDESGVKVDHRWFRGGWFDPLTMAWKELAAGACFDRAPVGEEQPSPGATLFVPFALAPGATRTIAVRLCWYAPVTNIRELTDPKLKDDPDQPAYKPWYAGQFPDIVAVARHWGSRYGELRARSARFADALHDSTLPPELMEAVTANLEILKAPTVLRQADGRLWMWEGCGDDTGVCPGSCTHVWNYAQAIAHLFPQLERTLRETEFNLNQDERGHQQFRTTLPIQPAFDHAHAAAADGQLGGIMKVHRDWRISGDTQWVRGLWPKVRRSLDYCIETWDPGHKGWVEEPHHNTYDVEFWGPDGMCASIYLGALQAAVSIGQALQDDVTLYRQLLEQGRKRAETELFDGEYFIQKVEWKNLRAANPVEFKGGWSAGYATEEALALLEQEGPKYQYGAGCLSDGVLGAWLAFVCGVGQVLDPAKVASHLRAVHRHNLRRDLSTHVNPQRPGFAAGTEGGLLLCTWPKGGALSLPFIYSNEVWTGIEYQVASHLIMMGLVDEGLEIVRICRDRYDGRVRNPFDEYECGHWYGRALSSYALLQAFSGARYDAVERVLYLAPPRPGDFRCFLAAATGFGTVGVRDGQPFVEVVSGSIPCARIEYRPATGRDVLSGDSAI